MSPPMMGLTAFAALLVLIGLRIPVAVAMGVVGAVGGLILNGPASVGFILGSAPFEAVFPYSLSVVPLFVMMGVFASRAGLSRSLYDAVNAFLGHFRGGLAMATVGACAAFGAICGSSLATAATMCRVAMPEMRRRGYRDSFASATIAAGGTLGVLIPPSIILVIYALLTEQSIGKLFVASLIPGLVATGLYIAAIAIQARINPTLGPAGERVTWAGRARAVIDVWPVLLLFALVIGGIYLGWFSPNEAAAVGAAGAILLSFVRRQLTREVFLACLSETASTTGMIFLILIGTSLFNYFIETTTLPHMLVGEVKALGWNRYAILFAIVAFYIVLGCFMESLSMITLTIPFIFPIIIALGFDPVWFGVVLLSVVEVGMITPPIGMNLFVIMATAPGLTMPTIVRGIVPFLAADMVRVALIIAIPALSLWLPSLM